jgi:predicted nucleotidyltransferase component of viral defense system
VKDSPYYRQAELLLRILPLIMSEQDFALKGGTAINFFVRDMPRLSVDIDLTYCPLTERQAALEDISAHLRHLAQAIMRVLPTSRIVFKTLHNPSFLKGAIVHWNDAVVKIEPNLVIRGTLFPVETKSLSRKAEEVFEMAMQVKTLSTSELYAGKICAALDRQHPRDLFDIRLMLNNERFDDAFRKAFIIYLISHPRSISELLQPTLKNISDAEFYEFHQVMRTPITHAELLAVREELVALILQSLTGQERQFLVSCMQETPEWDLLGLEHLERLPAVRWKLMNIRKMTHKKRQQETHRLRKYLEVG